jgi:hypothetical protein
MPCVNNSCGALPLGRDCTSDDQCGSGHCVTGLCCDAAGTSCAPTNVCHNGALFLCGGSSTVCLDVGSNVTNGTSCGTNKVCNGGACGACVANQACIPSSTACTLGMTSCAGGTQVCMDVGPGCAASCDAIRLQTGNTNDGKYFIDPDGAGALQPFQVYCYGMADMTKPAVDYLELVHSNDTGEPTSNFSRYAGGGYCQCMDDYRYFTKVRLVYSAGATPPLSIQDDGVFSRTSLVSSPASCTSKQPCTNTYPPAYGVASDCVTENGASGTANIDLRGTPFAIDASASWTLSGYLPAGSYTPSSDHKTAAITGGGACGTNSPTNGIIPLVQQ